MSRTYLLIQDTRISFPQIHLAVTVYTNKHTHKKITSTYYNSMLQSFTLSGIELATYGVGKLADINYSTSTQFRSPTTQTIIHLRHWDSSIEIQKEI